MKRRLYSLKTQLYNKWTSNMTEMQFQKQKAGLAVYSSKLGDNPMARGKRQLVCLRNQFIGCGWLCEKLGVSWFLHRVWSTDQFVKAKLFYWLFIAMCEDLRHCKFNYQIRMYYRTLKNSNFNGEYHHHNFNNQSIKFLKHYLSIIN